MNVMRPKIPYFAWLFVLALAILGSACSPAKPAPEEVEPSAEPAETVTYEPAYPTEVSDDELTEEDVVQQQTHSHGDEEHSHSEGEEHDDDH